MELKARSLAQSRDDANFLAAFRHSATVKTGEFPPAALVELYHEPEAIAARLRRLHLVIVDLCHPRKTATRTEKQFYQQMTRLRDAKGVSATPIPLCNQEKWRRRYVFGYSLDDSDKPAFLLWPEKTGNNGFWLLDVARNQYHNLCQATSIRNLGLEHFYAAFGLGCSRNLRTSSARAFGISENNIYLLRAFRHSMLTVGLLRSLVSSHVISVSFPAQASAFQSGSDSNIASKVPHSFHGHGIPLSPMI